MNIARCRIIRASAVGLLAAATFGGCARESQPVVDSGRLEEALGQRTDAVKTLAADASQMVNELVRLGETERNAVAGLVAMSKAVALYESRLGADSDVLREFYNSLTGYSAAFAGVGKFQAVIACFDASVACLGALKECEEEAEQGNRNADQCNGDPKVVEPCANEALCMLAEFEKLHEAVPDLLAGRDPWPPQPFPYERPGRERPGSIPR
jgi:hypothetical protein